MSDFKQRLLANHQHLTQNLVLDDVLSKLYVDRTINKHEYDTLKAIVFSHGMSKAADQLVVLLTKKDSPAYDSFLSSLRNSGQSGLAHQLEESATISPEFMLSKRDLEKLRANNDILVEEMNTSKVMKHLESNRTFWSSSKKQEVKAKTSPQMKAQALLDHVASGTYTKLTQLIEALQYAGQYDMIRKLPVGVNVGERVGRKEPDSILTQVTIIPAQDLTFSLVAGKRVCLKIVKMLNDAIADVRKKVTVDYNLKRLVATAIPWQPLKFTLELLPRSYPDYANIHTDVSSQHLALLIKQYSQVNETICRYSLQIQIVGQEISGGRFNQVIVYSRSLHEMTDLCLRKRKAKEAYTPVLCRRIVQEMIDSKEYTSYDLCVFLRKQKGSGYESPFDLSDDDCVPLTHMCVDRGRLNLLSVLLRMGWWTMLSNKKVPEGSGSPYKGMTCFDLAETKRARKPVNEVRVYTEWEDSLNAIMKAARSGDSARVETLIASEGEAIHNRDMNNGNALYWAVVSGKLEIFQDLLHSGGLDPMMRTNKKETLLHVACQLGMAEFIPELIACGIDVNSKDTEKRSALDIVAENGDIKTMEAFISCGIIPGDGFLAIATRCRRRSLLEYCLVKTHHCVDAMDQMNRTLIMRAVEGNNEDMVQYLLSKGARLDLVPKTSKSVLHIVAKTGNVKMLEILLSELQKQGRLKEFLAQKDKYNEPDHCFLVQDQDQRHTWHYVRVARQHIALFAKKFESGYIDVAASGTVIKSCFGNNAWGEITDYIEEMLRRTRLEVAAPDDSTPLHIAVFNGNTRVVKTLLRNEADVHVRDKFGLTPLMLAAAKDNLDMIKELESYGAGFEEVNWENKNAADIARENENIRAFNYIQGRDYFRMCENFRESHLTRLASMLSSEKLHELKTQKRDVKQYIIDTLLNLRDVTIKQILLDLGSSPILEASDDILPAPGTQPTPGPALQAPGGAVYPSQQGSNLFTEIRTPPPYANPNGIREYRVSCEVQQEEEGSGAFAIG